MRSPVHLVRACGHAAGWLVALSMAASAQAASPWFGTWTLRLARPADRAETLVYSDAGNGAMRMESIEDDSVIVTRFDGAPAFDTGAAAARKISLAVRALSPVRYAWTLAIAGTPRAQGVNTLAADLDSFSETSWPVGQPTRMTTVVYLRQQAPHR